MSLTRNEHLQSEEVAAEQIRDGMTVAFGEPAPMAMIRQVIRRGIRDLTVIAAGVSPTGNAQTRSPVFIWKAESWLFKGLKRDKPSMVGNP